MNNGNSHPSATIRAFTDERFLAAYRAFLLIGVSVLGFFLLRIVNGQDETNRQMEAFKLSIQSEVSSFKIDVARNTSTNNAMISAIQGRMDAHSRRMDGFDADMREVNKKLYDGRLGRP